MGVSGTAFLLKSIVGEETFQQIEAMSNDGTFAKIIAFAENSQAIVDALGRLEEKFDAIYKELVYKDAPEPAQVEGPSVDPGSDGPVSDPIGVQAEPLELERAQEVGPSHEPVTETRSAPEQLFDAVVGVSTDREGMPGASVAAGQSGDAGTSSGAVDSNSSGPGLIG